MAFSGLISLANAANEYDRLMQERHYQQQQYAANAYSLLTRQREPAAPSTLLLIEDEYETETTE